MLLSSVYFHVFSLSTRGGQKGARLTNPPAALHLSAAGCWCPAWRSTVPGKSPPAFPKSCWEFPFSLCRSCLGHSSKAQVTVGNQPSPPPGQQFPVTASLFAVPQAVFSRGDVSDTITSSVHSCFSPLSSASACVGTQATSHSHAERAHVGICDPRSCWAVY